MEASNLGAYSAGFSDPPDVLEGALAKLRSAPSFRDPDWLSVGYGAWRAMGHPASPEQSMNIGIPTWFYGHEPPNLFATHIAKYFENSVREEGLLAVALGGVIYAEGNAGTVQEMFQDACQNYYRTYDDVRSPMVLFGSDYWAPSDEHLQTPGNRRKRAYPLLAQLAAEQQFSERLLVTDDAWSIVEFIVGHPPA